MNFINIIFTIFILFSVSVSSIPIKDRFRYSDPDEENQINRHTNTVLFLQQSGGGWPSTTDNPSGGGRWN